MTIFVTHSSLSKRKALIILVCAAVYAESRSNLEVGKRRICTEIVGDVIKWVSDRKKWEAVQILCACTSKIFHFSTNLWLAERHFDGLQPFSLDQTITNSLFWLDFMWM